MLLLVNRAARKFAHAGNGFEFHNLHDNLCLSLYSRLHTLARLHRRGGDTDPVVNPRVSVCVPRRIQNRVLWLLASLYYL